MKLLGDPGYRMLSLSLALGAAALAVPIALAALAFMTDDWLFAHCPKYPFVLSISPSPHPM